MSDQIANIIFMVISIAAIVSAVLKAAVPKLKELSEKTANTWDDGIYKALATALRGVTMVLSVLEAVSSVLSARKPGK